MLRRLPPLNALRAFEAAARHLSIKKAAEEIGVTPAAVTQQVKLLESDLECAILRRSGRGIELTEYGARLFYVLQRSFSDISSVVSELTSHNPNEINASLQPTLAQRWLAPRLVELHQEHPRISVHISMSQQPIDFTLEDIDVAMQFGSGAWPSLRSTFVMAEQMFPVCSPALADRYEFPMSLDVLRRNPILHTIASPDDWPEWLARNGINDASSISSHYLENSALALEVAEHGLGFAMARTPFVISALASGRLVAPFSVRLESEFAHYLVSQQSSARRPEVARFRDWIVRQGTETTEFMKNYSWREQPVCLLTTHSRAGVRPDLTL